MMNIFIYRSVQISHNGQVGHSCTIWLKINSNKTHLLNTIKERILAVAAWNSHGICSDVLAKSFMQWSIIAVPQEERPKRLRRNLLHHKWDKGLAKIELLGCLSSIFIWCRIRMKECFVKSWKIIIGFLSCPSTHIYQNLFKKRMNNHNWLIMKNRLKQSLFNLILQKKANP